MSAFTRSAGSLTTSLPLTSMAKILVLILSADEPNAFFEPAVSEGWVTSGLPRNASQIDA
jgi:hypothetical protein